MTDIYEQHEKAFSNVAAFVVIDKATNETAFTIALKYPKNGAGRLWAYVQYLGQPMVRAYASGYGYDKASEAIAAAMARIKCESVSLADGSFEIVREPEPSPQALLDLQNAFANIGGRDWQNVFVDNGYKVMRAV